MPKKIMPIICPSCQSILEVAHLACNNCGTTVEGHFELSVLTCLDADDQTFIINFLKSSGNLKNMAHFYGISYPTVRNRLDTLIEKIKSMGPKETK